MRDNAKRAIAAILVTALVAMPFLSGYAMESYLDGKLPEWMSSAFVIAAFDARDEYGIPVSASLGQMIVETGPNLDSSPYTPLFIEHHNYGGARYYGQPQACGTIEAYGFEFCAFESDDAFLDFQYNHQLTSSRYTSNANVQKGCAENDWEAYITGLCEQGYAGSPTESVISDYVSAVAAQREAFPTLKAFDLMSKEMVMRLMFGVGGGDVVSRAESMIGVAKYVWGACNPDAAQFDCSGFVSWCLTGEAGHKWTTGDYITWPVAEDPQPGDVCVYHDPVKYPEYFGHCGIYIGDGKMIDCSTGVAVRDVDPQMIIVKYPYG